VVEKIGGRVQDCERLCWGEDNRAVTRLTARGHNHNGISEPWELRTLSEVGIQSISLEYSESGKVDRWGNRFRYRAKIMFADGTAKWAYDVFLQMDRSRR
jgi:hypothetical protein